MSPASYLTAPPRVAAPSIAWLGRVRAMAEVAFDVEQAGCATCAQRVRNALAPLADVREIAIDEDADSATVHAAGAGLSEDAVNRALAAASQGSGHTYRVREGSW